MTQRRKIVWLFLAIAFFCVDVGVQAGMPAPLPTYWTFINPSQDGPYFDDAGYGLSHVAGNIRVLPIRAVRHASKDTQVKLDRNWIEQLKKKNQLFKLSQIPDGTSNTILVGTVGERFKPWGHPANVRDPAEGVGRSPDGFGGPRSWNGGMFLMCDGSVKFLGNQTDLKLMRTLATPDGGESVANEISSAGPKR